MGLFGSLTEKPWLDGGTTSPVAPLSHAAIGIQARRSALRVFLGVVTILFTLMVIAYGGRMAYQDWRPAPQIQLLWANTAVLILGSALLQWALVSARRGSRDAVRLGLLAAGTFTLLFLFGQMMAWRQLAAMVLGDFSNPAVGFFYMITGVHGLHMLGGLAVLGRTTLRAWAGTGARQLVDSIGNCALYWHFLLGVWLVLFGLLFSGDNFALLLEICGLR
jgi:cytochrome c oxidase subunit 3